MIALHGDGDPTGRNEAFSFVKISMKGGFQPLGASVNDRIKGQQKADASGHKYNVRDQEEQYHTTIKQIWEAQTNSLNSNDAPDMDVEMDDNIDARIERNDSIAAFGRTPRSEAPGTPGYFPRQSDIDDSFSHISGSRISASDRQSGGRKLRIIRTTTDIHGDLHEREYIVDDPVVARQYKKRREALMKSRLDEQFRLGLTAGSGEMTPSGGVSSLTGNERKQIEEELDRLQKNKERRKVREAQKAAKLAQKNGESLFDADGNPMPGQTQRKCANCGQLGHIKTNKK
jgi:transcription initiation factor TFIID subunit 1